jgi:hypothetical protein
MSPCPCMHSAVAGPLCPSANVLALTVKVGHVGQASFRQLPSQPRNVVRSHGPQAQLRGRPRQRGDLLRSRGGMLSPLAKECKDSTHVQPWTTGCTIRTVLGRVTGHADVYLWAPYQGLSGAGHGKRLHADAGVQPSWAVSVVRRDQQGAAGGARVRQEGGCGGERKSWGARGGGGVRSRDGGGAGGDGRRCGGPVA